MLHTSTLQGVAIHKILNAKYIGIASYHKIYIKCKSREVFLELSFFNFFFHNQLSKQGIMPFSISEQKSGLINTSESDGRAILPAVKTRLEKESHFQPFTFSIVKGKKKKQDAKRIHHQTSSVIVHLHLNRRQINKNNQQIKQPQQSFTF